MSELQREPAPTTGNVWPPPPLGNAPTPLSFHVEGMRITQSGARLVVVNKSIRRLFAAEVCLLTLSLPVSPWINYWTNPFHPATLPGLLPSVISCYRTSHNQILFLFMLLVLAGVWRLLTCVGNLGGVTLDRTRGTLKAGCRWERPMSGIKAVLITETPNPTLGVQHVVSILWDGNRSANTKAKSCFLGALRREDHAEKVAETIANFAGVPVRYQARAKNSV